MGGGPMNLNRLRSILCHSADSLHCRSAGLPAGRPVDLQVLVLPM